MAERALKKKHGNIRLTIVRPSIVIACEEEPYPGWTETISAAGGISFGAHLGLVHFINCKLDIKADLIPADKCSNNIIVSTAYTGISPPGTFNISHSTSSSLKPVTAE